MDEIDHLGASLLADIAKAQDEAALEQVRIGALGKAGSISALLKTLGAMTPEERKEERQAERRRDLDISTFTSAILVRRAADRIASARVAYGGVGPTVVRMRATEAALAGQPFTEATFRGAGDVAVGEIRPLTDVRGSADYRLQLARSVLLKFFHEQTAMVG